MTLTPKFRAFQETEPVGMEKVTNPSFKVDMFQSAPGNAPGNAPGQMPDLFANQGDMNFQAIFVSDGYICRSLGQDGQEEGITGINGLVANSDFDPPHPPML